MNRAARRRAQRGKPQVIRMSKVNPHAAMMAISNCETYTEEELVGKFVRLRQCLKAILDGTATISDVDQLWMDTAVGGERSKSIDPKLVEIFNKAAQALSNCSDRKVEKGFFGLSPLEHAYVDHALDVLHTVALHSTRAQMKAAAQQVVKVCTRAAQVGTRRREERMMSR